MGWWSSFLIKSLFFALWIWLWCSLKNIRDWCTLNGSDIVDGLWITSVFLTYLEHAWPWCILILSGFSAPLMMFYFFHPDSSVIFRSWWVKIYFPFRENRFPILLVICSSFQVTFSYLVKCLIKFSLSHGFSVTESFHLREKLYFTFFHLIQVQ